MATLGLQTAPDVPLLIESPNSSSERRISPSWTIAQLKTRLEPITGIPASCQQLSLRFGSQDAVTLEAADEELTQLAAFPLQPFARITLGFIEAVCKLIWPCWERFSQVTDCQLPTNDISDVHDIRPPSARIDFSDVSAITKYEMPSAEYEARNDSVLAWKKSQKLGRFDPNAPSIEQQKIQASEREVEERGLTLSSRVRLLPETDARRGKISYIGAIPEIPGVGSWIGVTLDEPTGKNDGSVKGVRYFTCNANSGVFVKPERCEAGDFPPLDLDEEDLEEM